MPLKEFKAKLVPEIKELNLFIRRNLLSSSYTGEIISSIKGRGIEFEDYRDYSVEDDASRIDWIASKRSQRTLVREYKLEVNFNIMFIIDTSESMLFSSVSKLKCEYAAQVACSLFYGVLQSGNACGYALFNDGLIKMAKPVLGKKQFYVFTKEISNQKNYGGKKNMAKALQQILGILDKKALIFLISDFVGDDYTWLKFVKIMSEKHEIIGIMVRDQRDLFLPENIGQLIIEDPFSNEKLYIDAKDYFKLYNDYNTKQINFLKAVFESHRGGFLLLPTNINFLNPLLQFFRKRGGRWK